MNTTSVRTTVSSASISARPSENTRTIINDFGALTLTLFLLSTTRWGSYILPGPPYLADLCLGILICDRLLAMPIAGRGFPRIDPMTGCLVGFLLSVTLVAVCLGPLDSEAFRDVAPFFYGIFFFLAPPVRAKNLSRATKLITLFFGFHLAWTTMTLIAPAFGATVTTLGNPGVDVFSTRADVDGLVNGIAASLGLFRTLRGRHGALFFAWGLVLVLVTHSRVGLLTTILGIACAVGYASAQGRLGFPNRPSRWPTNHIVRVVRGHKPRSLAAVVAAMLVIAIISIAVAPTSVDRLTATFGTSKSTTVEKGAAASGTTTARLHAWSRLANWITENESRALVGAGFGSNIMLDSGAGLALVHTNDPSLRAPHNFLLTVWAHLGLLGLGTVVLIFLRGFWLAVRARRLQPDDVQLLAALLVIGVPVAAVAGVVLESPFGAIPYFWALGYLGSALTRPAIT